MDAFCKTAIGIPQLLNVTVFSFWHIDTEVVLEQIEFDHALLQRTKRTHVC